MLIHARPTWTAEPEPSRPTLKGRLAAFGARNAVRFAQWRAHRAQRQAAAETWRERRAQDQQYRAFIQINLIRPR